MEPHIICTVQKKKERADSIHHSDRQQFLSTEKAFGLLLRMRGECFVAPFCCCPSLQPLRILHLRTRLGTWSPSVIPVSSDPRRYFHSSLATNSTSQILKLARRMETVPIPWHSLRFSQILWRVCKQTLVDTKAKSGVRCINKVPLKFWAWKSVPGGQINYALTYISTADRGSEQLRVSMIHPAYLTMLPSTALRGKWAPR